MDAFAGAIGVSDSDGKASPVVHAYVGRCDVDPRYLAYALRNLASNGYVASLAKGIRERSTSFDPATLADVSLPVPSLEDQRRIADYLDHKLQSIDEAVKNYQRLATLTRIRLRAYVDQEFVDTAHMIPLRYLVRYREGPGIMAEDFHESGVPLIRVSGLRARSVSLQGCNFLDESKVRSTWRKFRLQMGDYLLSASASTGQVSVVDTALVVGAVPYTGIIVLRPANPAVHMPYIEALLASSVFLDQIDKLKAGMGMQHFGPTHLAQVRVPSVNQLRQQMIGKNYLALFQEVEKLSTYFRTAITLLQERKVSLIAAAVSGRIDVTTSSRM
jgi:type I restriction enzyme S subunit